MLLPHPHPLLHIYSAVSRSPMSAPGPLCTGTFWAVRYCHWPQTLLSEVGRRGGGRGGAGRDRAGGHDMTAIEWHCWHAGGCHHYTSF